MNNAQDIPDLWEMPYVVSKDTWAVTRCLEIHGNTANKWTPAHFVSIAMWYGGIKAGIQAAKAINIFGVWSPRVGVKNDELPSMEVKTGPRQILSKIWPSTEYEQKPLLDRANRLSHEEPFTNFDEAHNYLLRLCIGPNLAEFPTVVRPKLHRIDWSYLITDAQLCRTLAPILYHHFDQKVDLASASEAIVGYAIDGHTLKTYTSTLGSGSVKRNKAGGRSASRRGRNREKYVLHTDDNEDDEEDFGSGSNRSAAVKSEFGSLDTNNADPVRQQSYTQLQERFNASRSCVRGEQEHNINATRYARTGSTANAHSTAETQARDGQLSTSGHNNETEIKYCSAHKEPPKLSKQVMNHLYKQTCGVPSHQILSFSNSRNPPPTLPNYWKEIWRFRAVKKAFASGLKEDLPWPLEPSTLTLSPGSHGLLPTPLKERLFQDAKDGLVKRLFQDAKDDLVKIERFCRPIIID
ncbi:hypothetical protein KCU77_g3993, partial [Aureobasidium melanogenum]